MPMARNPTAAQRAAIEAILAAYEPRVRDAFLASIYSARAAIDLPVLIEALERRDVARAIELLRINQALIFPLEEAVRGSYIAGAQAVLPVLPRMISATWAFEGRHPRAEAWISDKGAELVQGIGADLEPVRSVILSGLDENRGAREVALDIAGRINPATGRREGGMLGLTTQQTDYVIRARQQLHDLDAGYFTRQLRDRRFDGLVRKAIRDGKPLAQADIDRITGRYKDRLLKARGDLIARNETFTAQAAGRDEAYRQIAARADVETVTVRWQHSPQERGRPDHIAMDGKKITLGEAFEMPDFVKMKHPHDPAGGAKHSANCKCIAVYRVELRGD